MKRLFITVLLAISLPAHAELLKTTSEVRAFTDKIMSHIGGGELDKAFNELKSTSLVTETEIDSVAIQSKAQRQKYAKFYGDSIGYEFIREQQVGESLLHLQYIEKTNMHAFPWSFYYYKTSKGWKLNTFNWNDQIKNLFVND